MTAFRYALQVSVCGCVFVGACVLSVYVYVRECVYVECVCALPKMGALL